MPLSPDLLAAYRDSDYVVFADPPIILKIGVPSPRLDALLEAEGAPCAAFVTAANPRSKPRSKEENAKALAGLDQLVAASGYPWRPAEGRESEGNWVEPSRLVIGISRDNAEALGRLFGQNAIVFIERGRAPELLVLV